MNNILFALALVGITNIAYGADSDSGYELTVVVTSPTATHKRNIPIRVVGKAVELKDPDLPKFIGCLMFVTAQASLVEAHVSCERFIGNTGRLDMNDFGTACTCGGPNTIMGVGTLEFTYNKTPWIIQIGCNPVTSNDH